MKRINVGSGAKWEDVVGYSRLVRTGDEIFVTGTVAFAPDGGFVGEGDAYAQACQCFRNIAAALRQVDAELHDIVRTRIYVTDIQRDWQSVGRAHAEFLGGVRPATTMVEVRRLIDDRCVVEIEADARPGFDTVITAARSQHAESGPPSSDEEQSAGQESKSPETSSQSVEDPEPRIRPAAVNDLQEIASLLGAGGLPVPDTRDNPVHFLVLAAGMKTQACAGWEDHGDKALLRSVAVAEDWRGNGIGTRMVETLVQGLEFSGVREVFLLTIDAQDFFARLGFKPVDREKVPDAIKSSHEFVIHACDDATCMGTSLPLPTINE